MNRRAFLFLVVLGALAGTWNLQRQRSLIADARAALSNRAAQAESPTPLDPPADITRPRGERPSSELLQLRNEVTLLRRDLESPAPRSFFREQAAQDWALMHSGPKPSAQPGFRHFTTLTNVGFSTPEAAFQSFNYAMRHQHKEPMNNTRTEDLWDVPDDYDAPEARYSIDIGEGMGSEFGYRIVDLERIATNQVRLRIDYEKPDGGSFRRARVLVEKNGRWRLKPVKVTREPPAVER